MKFAFYLIIVFLHFHVLKAGAQNGWIAPKEACAMENPVENNASVQSRARNIYMNMCSPCHGVDGKGSGPVSAVLNPKPANHTADSVQREPDGALFWKITTGKGQMRSYKDQLTDEQRWGLVRYIKSLKK